MSWKGVRLELISQGFNIENATTVVSSLKQQEHEAKIDASNKELWYGVFWAIGGIALTVINGGAFSTEPFCVGRMTYIKPKLKPPKR